MDSITEISNIVQRSKRMSRLIEGARIGSFRGWLKWIDVKDFSVYKTKDAGIVYTVYDRRDGTRTILEDMRDITEVSSC